MVGLRGLLIALCMLTLLPIEASGAYLWWAKNRVTYRYVADTKEGWYGYNTVQGSYATFEECKAAMDKSLSFTAMMADFLETKGSDPSTWTKEQQENWAKSQAKYKKSAGYRMQGDFKSLMVVGTSEIRFWERGSQRTEHICLPDTITFPEKEEGVPSSK